MSQDEGLYELRQAEDEVSVAKFWIWKIRKDMFKVRAVPYRW